MSQRLEDVNHPPKISIVTPSYNQGPFIEDTIKSVLDQNYSNLEFIIIDGGSTDQTVSILKKYDSAITRWVSEPDEGQSDAINKGFQFATGDICCYLNSDDLLLPNALQTVADHFLATDCQWLSGICFYGPHLQTAQTQHPFIHSFPEFVTTMSIAQQATFWRSDVLDKPYFDPAFHFRMDHDFFIRLLNHHGLPHFISEKLAFFRIHEQAKTALLQDVSDREREILLNREIEGASAEIKLGLLKEKRLLKQRSPVVKLLNQIGSAPQRTFSLLLMATKCPALLKDRFYWGALRRVLTSSLRY